MRISVIGYKGIVGNATYEVLRRLGQDVVGVEKDDPAKEADIYMICVPEDFAEDAFLNKVPQGENKLVVLRSTVPPGTTKRLQVKYPERHFMHMPEYLREATSLHDAYFAQYIVFGDCCKEHADIMQGIYQNLNIKMFHTNTTTSEMTKYTINNFKAVLISYWNSLFLLAEQLKGTQAEFDPHQVARIAVNDSVIPNYGTILGGAYGGKCLPKDIKKFVKFCEENNVNANICKATMQINEEIKYYYGESKVRTGN